MFLALAFVAVAALGFGAGRVKHPANLTLANIKAEIAKIEAEVYSSKADVVARLKALL